MVALIGKLGEAGDLLARNDDDVDRGLGVDVAEGHDVLILVHDVGRISRLMIRVNKVAIVMSLSECYGGLARLYCRNVF